MADRGGGAGLVVLLLDSWAFIVQAWHAGEHAIWCSTLPGLGGAFQTLALR